MKTSLSAVFALFALAAPVMAQDLGDAEKGEKAFSKCRACHMIQTPEGVDVIKGGVTGPNLYGIVGRKIASNEEYRYSPGLQAMAEANPDAVWDVYSLAAFMTDPGKYVAEHAGDSKARTKMTFKLNRDQVDLAAYLLSQSPDAPEQPAEGDGSPQP